MTVKVITKDSEAKLMELLSSFQGISSNSKGWRCLHFRLNELQDHNKSEYQLKIATNIITDLLEDADGNVYLCADNDLFIVTKEVTKTTVDKIIFQLRYLFSEDPLAYTAEGAENEQFSEQYDLSVKLPEVITLAKAKLGGMARSGSQMNVILNKQHLKPLTPGRLATIEKDLSQADLTHIMRHQPVCAIVDPKSSPRPVFEEMYVNISHLRQLMGEDIDFFSNRWLFRYLTHILDERMMTILQRRPGFYFKSPVSINLNIDTVLSDNFASFDASLDESIKKTIIIEIQVSEVFADMSAFILAKDILQKSGYRVCVDGLTTQNIFHVDRERLGFDMAKLQWNADIIAENMTKEAKKIAHSVQTCGNKRIILCRCDNRQAIDYGHAIGISLFQGRYVDKFLNPDATIVN